MSTTEPRARTAPSRPSAGLTAGIIALTWAIAIAFVLTVASDTRMGPVVYRITEKHGVHLGDVYATLGCAAVAVLITVWAIIEHRGRARRFRTYEARRARFLAEAELDEHDVLDTGPADPDLQETAYFDGGLLAPDAVDPEPDDPDPVDQDPADHEPAQPSLFDPAAAASELREVGLRRPTRGRHALED